MIKKFVFLLMLFIPSVCLGDLYFYDDCEDAPVVPTTWGLDQPAGSLTVSNEQARTGTNSYKIYFDGDCTGWSRVELILRDSVDTINFAFDREYWVGWSIYVPTNFSIPSGVLTGQWHNAGQDLDDNCDQGPRPEYPAVAQAFMMYMENYDGGIRYKTQITGQNDFCQAYETYDYRQSFTSNKLVLGAWNDIVVHIRFSYTNTGYAQVWLNGENFIDISGVATAHNDPKAPYLKLGYYGACGVTNTIYLDEVRVGDADSSYGEVSPAGGPPDATPPVRSGGTPSGTLATGTTSTTLGLTTAYENATCKYGTVAGTAYASIANTFSTTGTTTHSQSISGLTDGNTYTYYVRCTDGTNVNTDDYPISFSVDEGGAQTNLVTFNTMLSYNCSASEALDAYDGCVDNLSGCMAGIAGDLLEFTINLGAPYHNLTRRIFGDDIETGMSKTLTVDYSLNGIDWTNFETDTNILASAWNEDTMTDVIAQFIRIRVENDTGSTQIREMELFGTVYEGTPTPPTVVSGKIRAVESANGVRMTPSGKARSVLIDHLK